MFAMRLVAWFVQLAYSFCSLFFQQNKIAFLSRQSSRPFDFDLLEPSLEHAFPDYRIVWACVPESGAFGPVLALKQVWHVATSRLCFADGYVPAVCIPHRHRSCCVQLWHALGAIKKFGYQALDTSDGRSSKAANALRMHRGYDVVVAGLPGAVPSFAEAFDCPSSNISPLGLPRIDYLVSDELAPLRAERSRAVAEKLGIGRRRDSIVVLYAPTLRRGVEEGEGWFERSVRELEKAFSSSKTTLVVAGHPLQSCSEMEEGRSIFLQGVSTIDALDLADYVVTDYSAVAFEAAILSKKVLFYVPDIREYRISPGLNLDPVESYPQLAFESAKDLASAVDDDVLKDDLICPFDEVARAYVGEKRPGSIERIVSYAKSMVSGGSPVISEGEESAHATV